MGTPEGKGVRVNVQLTHFAVQQKLPRWEADILQNQPKRLSFDMPGKGFGDKVPVGHVLLLQRDPFSLLQVPHVS